MLTFLLLFCLLAGVDSAGQARADKLRLYLSDSNWYMNRQIRNIGEVKKFYAAFNYEPQWTDKKHIDHRVFLFILLHNVAKWGLYNTDYYPELNSENTQLSTAEIDLAEEDIKLTDAAIHFYSDLKYGNTIPSIGFDGLKYTPVANDIASLLVQAIGENSLDELCAKVSDGLPEVNPFLNKIRWIQYQFCDSDFKEVVILSKMISRTNAPLITKLYQLGLIYSPLEPVTDSILSQAVEFAAEMFGLTVKPGGEMGKMMIEQLNVPLYKRLEQLFLSLNYYRWLSDLQNNGKVTVVNIPAAALKVYHKNEIILSMRMIVGKPTTPTPTLLSRISEVTLYPYWTVPARIATKELLPQIKKDRGFIQSGNFQVLNKAGKIINPDTVTWQLYTKANFPFTLRQSTGCDNALGILKLSFDNPFGVYLHDTPDKNLFSRSGRYFSHGCMRMEKPFDMARLVLKNNLQAIDTLDKTCLNNHLPVHVPADEQIAVLVWYNPAGINSSGRIQFYEDIYKQFPANDKALIDMKRVTD